MNDQPTAAELLQAMARTLTDDVVPTTKGSARHSARVVANLCGILARELTDTTDDEGRAQMLALLGVDDNEADLATVLDQRIRDFDPVFDEAALPLLLADVERRLAIARPDYLTGPS